MVRFEEESSEQQLLPGIPDDITVDLIIEKLSWKTRRLLPAVSRSWNQSLLDARIRSLATEVYVVILNDNFLISLVDGFCYQLPPIPNVGTGGSEIGYTKGSGSVFLDGRIYCLGGNQYDSNNFCIRTRDEVYVMDVGRERKWQQCKSMPHARRWKDCVGSVLGLRGKIYLIDQNSRDGRSPCVNYMDVYEPKTGTWYRIETVHGLSILDAVPGLRGALFDSFKTCQALGKKLKLKLKKGLLRPSAETYILRT